MIKRTMIEEVLEYVTGKTPHLGRKNKYKGNVYRMLNQALKNAHGKGKFNPNLDGEELYKNATDCLRAANFRIEENV